MSLTNPQLSALLAAVKSNPEWSLQQAFQLGAVAAASAAFAQAVQRAAELLEHEAECLRECHAPDNNWCGESAAKADYDEFKQVAKALRGCA